MPHWQCLVCGYIHEGDRPPAKCPVCGAPAEKFKPLEIKDEATAQLQHYDWEDESQSVGLLIAYSRRAEEEGYPELAQAFYRMALDEARHAAEWAFIKGLVDTTRENLARQYNREITAKKNKEDLARAAQKNGDFHSMAFFIRAAADEDRHAAIIKGLLGRYFNNT